MRFPSPRFLGLLVATLTACSLDSTNPTGTGAGGDSTSSSDATTTSAVSGTGGMTTSSTDATTSSTASSGSTSSVSSSSSTGGGTLPFCFPTTDDFNGYGGQDGTFISNGENNGPWMEDPPNSGDVRLTQGGRIQTQYGGGNGAFLLLKATVQPASTCAITVHLAATSGGEMGFGIWDKTADFTEITCVESAGGCQPLRAFGVDGGTVKFVNGGLYFGLVIQGTRVFGLYSGDGTTWSLIPNQNANGSDAGNVLDFPVTTYFGQNPNSNDSEWDDFDVRAIPVSALP